VRFLQEVICGEYYEDDQEDEEARELEDVFFECHDGFLYSLIYNSWS